MATTSGLLRSHNLGRHAMLFPQRAEWSSMTTQIKAAMETSIYILPQSQALSLLPPLWLRETREAKEREPGIEVDKYTSRPNCSKGG